MIRTSTRLNIPKWMLSVCLCILTTSLMGQMIRGKVTAADDKIGLPGVNVVVKGTDRGTVTNGQGEYNIQADPGAVLVFSFVGYETTEVPVGDNSTINVEMGTDSEALDEVVVVGYGTQRKSDVTGSIVSVGEKAMKEVPVANISQGLQGRAAGVQVTRTSSRPGATPQIRIRGNRSLSGDNDPLFVVDGIPYAGSINDINPNDIISVDILKDASATAIYGSRGSNGVILVTTKRGKSGEPEFYYNSYIGLNQVRAKYPTYNAEEFLNLRTVSGYSAEPGTETPQEEEAVRVNDDGSVTILRDTDWQDLVYKDGMITNHDLGVSGGNDDTRYSLSANYFRETTVLPGQAFNRGTLRATVDQQVGTRVRIGLNTINTLSITNGESANPMYSILALNPLTTPYDSAGNFIDRPATPVHDMWNPMFLYGDEDLWEEERRRIRTFNSLYGEVQILENLRYRLNVGLDYRQDNYGSFFGSATQFQSGGLNQATLDNEAGYSVVLENLLYYDQTFGNNHNLKLTGLYSYQDEERTRTRVQFQDIISDYIQYYNPNYANFLNADNSGYYKRVILSYMARANYDYDRRYLFTATARYDGSSVLAAGNQWNFYPAFAAGWNIAREDFLENQRVVNNLKLRAGWGETANQSIAPFQSTGGMAEIPYNFGSDVINGYFVNTLPNDRLTWETTQTTNIGIDFAFLDYRISGAIEYYNAHTTGILLSQQLPPTSGVSGSFLTNVGETRNRGLELSLTTANIRSEEPGGFNWSTDLNFYLNREEILQLQHDSITQDVGNNWFVGHPINVIYDYQKLGIWQTSEEDDAEVFFQEPGQIKVADLNGDGAITPEDDRTIIGNLQPDFNIGMTNRFTYRDFDLSVVAFARVGGYIVSTIHQPNSYLNNLQGRISGIRVDYWTEDNQDGTFPEPDATRENPLYGSTLGYYDGTFVKIRSINFGYNLPSSAVDFMGLSSFRVYFSARDPFILFSPYVNEVGGVDPEPTGTRGTFQNNGSVGQNALVVTANTPSVRSFIFGINVNF